MTCFGLLLLITKTPPMDRLTTFWKQHLNQSQFIKNLQYQRLQLHMSWLKNVSESAVKALGFLSS